MLASSETSVDRQEYTMMADEEPRLLRPFGKVQSELYDIDLDPHQLREITDEDLDLAKKLKHDFIISPRIAER